MSANIFNDSPNLSIGPRLTNIQKQVINTSKLLVFDGNSSVSQINFNPAISPILNQSSLDSLKTLLLDNTEEAIVYTANSSDIIEFHTGLAGGAPDSSNLRMEITNTDTTIKNNLSVANIETQQIKSNQSNGELYFNNSDTTQRFRFVADSNNYIQTFSNVITFSKWANPTVGLKIDHTALTCEIPYSLLTDTIKDASGNTAIKSTSATNTTFTKQTNTFQFENSPSSGYIAIHNSNSTQSAYIQWYSYDSSGAGSYPRNAYLGLSSHAGGSANDLKLSLENNVSFNILKNADSVMRFDNVNNKIVVSNPLYTKDIIPDIATSTAPDFVTSIYSLGEDTRRWENIYLKNAPIHGSDKRLKKDIKPLDFNSLEVLLKLEPVLFKWKQNQSGRNHIGFIAQQIEKIPQLANTGFFCKSKDSSTMSLRSGELIPVLVGGIQQLNDKLNDKHDKLKELITELLDKHQELFNQKQEDDPFENLKLLISENNIDKPVGDDELAKLNKEKLIDLERKIKILDDAKDEHKCGELTILKEDIEQLCQSKDALEQELFKFKTQNDILEQRIIELENIDYHQQSAEAVIGSAPAVDNNELVLLKNRIDILEERDMMDDSDATQTSQIDIIMSRLNLLESENKKLKAKVAKQTTIINKILTSK